jgi:hypothetical protein
MDHVLYMELSLLHYFILKTMEIRSYSSPFMFQDPLGDWFGWKLLKHRSSWTFYPDFFYFFGICLFFLCYVNLWSLRCCPLHVKHLQNSRRDCCRTVLSPPFSVNHRAQRTAVQFTKRREYARLCSIDSSVDAQPSSIRNTEFPTLLTFKDKLNIITKWQQTMESNAQCRGACAVCAHNVLASDLKRVHPEKSSLHLLQNDCSPELFSNSKVIGMPSDQKGPGMPGGPLYWTCLTCRKRYAWTVVATNTHRLSKKRKKKVAVFELFVVRIWFVWRHSDEHRLGLLHTADGLEGACVSMCFQCVSLEHSKFYFKFL